MISSWGDVFVWEENGQVVFNLGTQQSWKTKAELWAIERFIIEMVREAERRGVQEIALPRIGAGLGGLEWKVVRAVLEKVGETAPVRLRVGETYAEGSPLKGLFA